MNPEAPQVPAPLAGLVKVVSRPWGDLVLHVGERQDGDEPGSWAVALRGDQVAFALGLSRERFHRQSSFGEVELVVSSIDPDPNSVVFVDDEVVILTELHPDRRWPHGAWSAVITRDGVHRARVTGVVDRALPPRRVGRFLRLQRVVDVRNPEPVVWIDLAGVDVTYGPAAYCAVVSGHRVVDPFRRIGRCREGHGTALSDGRAVSFLAFPAMDEAARTRLFEAWGERFSAQLPGVLRSRGWCPSVEDDVPWLLVFEARTGAPLSEQVRKNKPLAPDRARRVLEAVAGILAEAHDRGRWHGYLWPGGVGFGDHEVWLRDVGLDRALDALGVPWPSPPHDLPADEPWSFAAPEVLAGGGDARSDVWSFGLLAYHVRTGARYWRAERDAEALRAEILRGRRPIPSVRARRQRLDDVAFPDAAFDAWFGRCVVRDPGRRFRDLREAIACLPW